MRPADIAQLKADLVDFGAELENPGVRAKLVASVLPRLLGTLELIPDALAGGDILELGSSPYFLSLCLRRQGCGAVRHGNYFGTADRRATERLVNRRSGEVVRVESDLFDVERDEFPYPDASFDAVIFSELIEHLGLNPVWTLSEIHRVLRPGGVVIVTTPNKLSLGRFATFLQGGSQMVDRYSPLFGAGARHNREYGAFELCELVEGCGFAIEALRVRNLAPTPLRWRLEHAVWRLFLRCYSNAAREEHIFLRARRGDRFRWHFPTGLFDNLQFFVLVRHPWMEAGYNDSIQCGAGWFPAAEPPEDHQRWIQGDEGQAFLRTPPGATTFGLEAFAAPLAGGGELELRAVVADRWLGAGAPDHVYADAPVRLRRGAWQRIELPLRRAPKPADEVTVRLRLDPAAAPGPPESARRVAVRKLWLT